MTREPLVDALDQVRAPSARDFETLRTLICSTTGIELSDAKRMLLFARLAPRLRELGMTRFDEYVDRVFSDNEERATMLDRITTNETAFFREPRQFDFLEQRLCPAWRAEAAAGRRPRHVRVWSAACATGEEPYSIAMVLLTHLPIEAGWSHEIIATDLSRRVLGRASQATWSIDRAKQIPRRYLHAFMLRGTGANESLLRAGPELRAIVRFRHANLNEPTYPVAGTFDLVFCRNVLIYFAQEVRRQVVERLLVRLGRNGLLFMGPAEMLHGMPDRVRAVAPNVYARTSNTLAPPRQRKEMAGERTSE